MRSWIVAAVVATGLLVAVDAAPQPTGTTDRSTTGREVANLWVDTTGGTCRRRTARTGYVAATACASMRDAYAAAACGDLVLVVPGTYRTQTIVETGSGSRCGSARKVTIQ